MGEEASGLSNNGVSHIKDLVTDPRNARRHNARNIGMIGDSLQEVGAARSIVIDEDGVILAGNGVVEAAAERGIEKVQIIDADGETIIAVRRSGLTPEQKTRLALWDNRTAEIADWNPEVLASLLQEDEAILKGLFDKDELARLLAEMPGQDEWGQAMGTLPEGDKSPFQQMTFTVSDEQAEIVGRALSRAKSAAPFVETGNENSNGNALSRICECYLG